MTTTAMRTANNGLKLAKKTTPHLHHTCLYISLMSLYKDDVNCFISHFEEEMNSMQRFFRYFLKTYTQPFGGQFQKN